MEKNSNSLNNFITRPRSFLSDVFNVLVPNHGYSYTDILKQRRQEIERWGQVVGGFLYLLHLPRESKVSKMSSELLIKSRVGKFYIICFLHYIVYLMKIERFAKGAKITESHLKLARLSQDVKKNRS